MALVERSKFGLNELLGLFNVWLRMVCPPTGPTTQIVISVWRYANVKVTSDVAGRAHWAVLCPLGFTSLQDLDEVTDCRLARVHRD